MNPIRAFLSAIIITVVAPRSPALEPARSLFNGHDLAGWRTYLTTPARSITFAGESRNEKGEHAAALGLDHDPTQVFSVVTVDGGPTIRISGQIFGALTTVDSFSNYILRLEMRWGDKKWEPRLALPRDGGILYQANGNWGEAGAWLPSLEFQVEEGDFGDLWAVNARATATARRNGDKDWIYDPGSPPKIFDQFGEIRRCLKQLDREKPRGEWNTLEVVCLGDRSWHIVNGAVVMRLTNNAVRVGQSWLPATSGRIQLQSEGAEHFVRHITLQPITELPQGL